MDAFDREESVDDIAITQAKSDIKCDPSTDPITLSRFMLSEQHRHPGAEGEFTLLLTSIQLACKVITTAVRKAGISQLYGLEGSVNVQGEDQKKLDIIANENFLSALKYSKQLSILVSEELDDPVFIDEHLSGKYIVVCDPLDGSSNIDCNVSVGSIFGVYRKTCADDQMGTLDDVLQPGRNLVAAGYCTYGSSTQLVLSTGMGVNLFTLDPSVGEFILTEYNLEIPQPPKRIYSINEGNSTSWDIPTTMFVQSVKKRRNPYSLRYVGSMVADVHRTLLYGGIFMYPPDRKNPTGKLRLLYECNPMAFIIEQAGGMATTGTERILDIQPKSIHERRPIFLGCKRDVERVLELYRMTANDKS